MKPFLTLLLFLPLALSAQVFKGESVEFDSIGHRFLTSDNGTSIVQRAENGAISYFGQGLLASYGMEIMNNTLFAIEGSSIFAYDLGTATQIGVINIPAATFLNGLASDGSHRIWATDFSAGKIYQADVTNLAAPVVTAIVANYGGTPNGIVYDAPNNRLVVSSWGANAAIKAVDLGNNNVLSTLVTTNLTNIDGVCKDQYGNFFLASWSPDKIRRYDNAFTQFTDITVAGLNNPADICYATSIDTLAIPNTAANNILFVGFQAPVGISQVTARSFNMEVYPNPVTSDSRISFESPVSGPMSCRITDVKGREVYVHPRQEAQVGKNILELSDFVAVPGAYYCVLRIESQEMTLKMMKL